METFWTKSWQTVAPKRIAEYFKSMDMEPDEIIDMLRRHQVRTVCDAGCGCGIYCAKLLHNGFSVTGYPSNGFDAVVSRDVLDHMTKDDARLALLELYRIVRPGGIVIYTLDFSDEEYDREPHDKNGDGDLVYTNGKWDGMVFHPYSFEEIVEILPEIDRYDIEQGNDHYMVILQKKAMEA